MRSRRRLFHMAVRTGRARPAAAGILLGAVILTGGCSTEDGPNLPPRASLEPGLVEGDTVSYRLPVAWTGEDPDGRIDHFEFALDPPAAFSEQEIAEGDPGITEELIPGTDGAPTVTRVRKTVNGEVVSFDWEHTSQTRHTFTFSATRSESTLVDTTRVPTGRFHGMHALYLRAVDNDGARSEPDRVAFTSKSLAPSANLVFPMVSTDDWAKFGAQVTFRWLGSDPDGPPPRRYLVKLVGGMEYGTSVSQIESRLREPEGWFWETEAPEFGFYFVQGNYALAIRAVDEAGAADPFLEWGQNVIRFEGSRDVAPTLTVSGVLLSRVATYPMDDFELRVPFQPQGMIELPPWVPLEFMWSATAEAYGGTLYGYSWGLDLVSTEEADPGWSTWGFRTSSPPARLGPGVHSFYVRARDLGGATALRVVTFRVVEFTFDREILVVDDSFDDTFPRDSDHDAFWTALADDYAATSGMPRDQFFTFDAHGAGDRGTLDPVIPLLSELARYKLVVWECRGSGYNAQTALNGAAAKTPRLAGYLLAGGRLWLGGRMTAGAMTLSQNGQGGDLRYPNDELGPGDFAWDFLKLRTRICNDKAAHKLDMFHEAIPIPGLPAPYDTLEVDLSKLSLAQRSAGGFSHADALCGPLDYASDPGFLGVLEPLYTYGAAGDSMSAYDGRVCALRWHDPAPDPLHGRIQWFGFPLYYMKLPQAAAVFRTSLDWFRDVPAPAAP